MALGPNQVARLEGMALCELTTVRTTDLVRCSNHDATPAKQQTNTMDGWQIQAHEKEVRKVEAIAQLLTRGTTGLSSIMTVLFCNDNAI